MKSLHHRHRLLLLFFSQLFLSLYSLHDNRNHHSILHGVASHGEGDNNHHGFQYFQRKLKIPIIHNENIQSVRLLQEGLDFIHRIQNPINCTGHKYMITDIGIGGGFASQFQLAASIWMRSLAETNYEMPIIIQGKLMGYSEGKECEPSNYQWTCFFLPASSCEKELLATGIQVTERARYFSNDESIPEPFQKYGFMFWWSVIQSYLFRLQPFLQTYITMTTQSMSNGRTFPYGLPMAGVHVRHGDKKIDSWKEFSLHEELQCLLSSKDCHYYHENTSTCYYNFPLTNYYSNIILLKALHNQTTIFHDEDLPSIDINCSDSIHHYMIPPKDLLKLKKKYYGASLFHSFSSSSLSSGQTGASSHGHHHYHPDHHNIIFNPFLLTANTSSTQTIYNLTMIEEVIRSYEILNHLEEMKEHPYYKQHHPSHTPLSETEGGIDGVGQNEAETLTTLQELNQIKSFLHSHNYSIPLDVFIASDDGEVIKYAQKMKYFVNKEGISQQTQGNAMISVVLKNRDSSFEASLQIISDIFLLSQCSTLIGMAASQVFRMAVGLSYARGTLKYVKAIDYHAIPKIRQMSNKYKLPFPEPFAE